MDFERLIAGYRRFREHGWSEQRERWAELVSGQSPKAMIIACSDSRVDPAQIFDARPGEMFVVRNVAALVPPFEPDENYHGVSAALEFAVTQLNVEDIVVMVNTDSGHVGYGSGIHMCVGQLVARLEGETMMAALAHKVGTIEITGPVTRRYNNTLRGLESLPVTITPA